MPGSKTYTSSKWTELLEADIEEQFRQNTHPSVLDRFGNAVIETLKIAAAAIVSIYLELVKDEIDPAIQKMPPNEILIILARKAISFVAVFALSYIVVTLLHAIFKFLLDALLNSRIIPSRKRTAKARFHRVTANYIMLSMSFENKMREYVRRIEVLATKRHGWSSENKANMDTYINMVCGYYAEAIYYSSLALEGLNEALPPVARFGIRQYWNTRFCNYIGIDYIANSIHMLEGTIDRMQMVANDMSDIIKKVELRTEMASRLSIVSTFKQRLDDNDIELKKLKTCMSHYTKAIEKSVTT